MKKNKISETLGWFFLLVGFVVLFNGIADLLFSNYVARSLDDFIANASAEMKRDVNKNIRINGVMSLIFSGLLILNSNGLLRCRAWAKKVCLFTFSFFLIFFLFSFIVDLINRETFIQYSKVFVVIFSALMLLYFKKLSEPG